MQISINNSTFQAKMDISGINRNKAKWKKIATIFEQKTKKYPNDTFVIMDEPNSEYLDFYVQHSKKENNFDDIPSHISPVIYGLFKILPESTVADKLKKIFYIQKKSDVMNHKYFEFERECIKYKDNGKDKVTKADDPLNKLQDDFYMAFRRIDNDFINYSLQKDEILSIPNGIEFT